MEELALAIQYLNEHPTKEEIQEMMNEADVDGDGTVDFEEFLTVMSRKMKVKFINEKNKLIILYLYYICTYIIKIFERSNYIFKIDGLLYDRKTW